MSQAKGLGVKSTSRSQLECKHPPRPLRGVVSGATENPLHAGVFRGGRYWIRTSDPTDVNRVLYR